MNSLFCAMTKKDRRPDINGHDACLVPLLSNGRGAIGEIRYIKQAQNKLVVYARALM